uniref:Tc1-like transposase DDE domain-containing protein n=1 Tax=Strongyloides stercoralis TaxID=6248 RepID=A0AAF5DJ01_STRER
SSIQKKLKGYPSRKLETAMTKVKENIKEDLTLSTRWFSAFTTTQITTVWRAIKANNFKSYKMVSMWSLDNPRWFEKRPLHSPQVTVWRTISSSKVYGTYFFEGNVSGQSCLDLLKSQVFQNVVKKLSLGKFVFIQDGAPPYYPKKVREWFNSSLNGCWMIRESKNLATTNLVKEELLILRNCTSQYPKDQETP